MKTLTLALLSLLLATPMLANTPPQTIKQSSIDAFATAQGNANLYGKKTALKISGSSTTFTDGNNGIAASDIAAQLKASGRNTGGSVAIQSQANIVKTSTGGH